MATLTSLNILTPTRAVIAKATDAPKSQPIFNLNNQWKRTGYNRLGLGLGLGSAGRIQVRRVRAAPDKISEKVEESIKSAQEACEGDPTSGECVAAWDEVEELSAAASHARDKAKENDPLENYCKDNPETDECRTYDD